MASKTRSTLSFLAKVFVAVALITYLVKWGHLDPKELWSLMTLPNILLALFLVGLGTILAAWRWILLLNSRGFNLTFLNGVSLYLIGIFFNYALPGAVGGDVVRGYYLVADHPKQKLDAVLSIVIDRVLGLYSFFLLTLVAVACDFKFVQSQEQVRWVAYLAALIFVAMTAFFLVVFSQRLAKLSGLSFFEKRIAIVQKVVMAFRRYGQNRRVIFASVVVSVLAQVVTMLFFYQVAMISGEVAINWRAILFAVPMGFLVTAIPIAPAGIGVGQVAFLYLFRTYLQSDTQFGATAITAFQLTQAAWALVGAACYLRRRKPQDLQHAVAEMS
jgi:uncharacterized protein (TIRG00374 family)